MVSRRFLFIAILLLFVFFAHTGKSQTLAIDSLVVKLKIHFDLPDTLRVNLLNQVAFLNYPDNLDALKYYSELSLNLGVKIGFKKGIALAYQYQGLYFAAKNADPVALELFKHSYLIFRQIGDRNGSARTLMYIGDYYARLKDYNTQLYFYNTASKERPVFSDYHLKGQLLGNIGQANENLALLEQADSSYNKLLGLALDTKDKDLLATAYRHLASVNFISGNHLIALDLARKGLSILHKNSSLNRKEGGKMDNLMGRIYFDLRNFKKCKEYLNASMTIARRVHDNESISQNYYDFYQLDSITENYKAAISNFLRYKHMVDSVQKAASDQRLAKFQIQFKIERNIAENQRLKKEDARFKSVIAFQNISLILLIGGMIIIVSGLFYLQHTNKEVKSKNEIIKKQNQNLANINLVKDKLFSVVSHDLRGPILQVKGLLNLFQSGNVDDDELRMLTPKVQENLDKTLELVDNLLIWSKNQMQGFKVKPSQFKICQLVNDNITYFETQIAAKKQMVYNQILPEDLLFADREMINIIVRNLLSNAIKFTHDAGSITIYARQIESLMTVSIEDSGVGVNLDNLDKIFAFVNYSTPGTQNEKGSGVGLKLCKDLIELNNGIIWYEGKPSGGSIFHFRLSYVPVLDATAESSMASV